MANFKCEEMSSCENFQSAICLHCNRRLCLLHITEHNQIVGSNLSNLSNDIEITVQQINEESEKRRNIHNYILTSFDQWRTQQIEKIQQIYENQLQSIESQRANLDNIQENLYEQLERDARQPLEHLQSQQNTNIEIVNHIRQTIEKVREDNVHLKWNLSTPPPPVNIEYSSLHFPAMPTTNKNKPIPKQSATKKKAASTNVVKQNKGCSLYRLVEMFSNISSIEQTRNDIADYIKRQGRLYKLPILICSYLTAWHRKSKIDEQVFLLNEHLLTIQQYLTTCKTKFDLVIGIQAFFFNEKIQENKGEMMTFLLQFFLSHQCIKQKQILRWYNNRDKNGYQGFGQAEQLATPFIESLSTINTVNNVQTVSTNPPTVDQCCDIEIKQEPVIFTLNTL